MLFIPSFSIKKLNISRGKDVPEGYMHQFWNSVYKHDTFYRFKLDKKKRFKLTLKVFGYIFQIFLRVQGQDLDALPSKEDTVSFLRELSYTGIARKFKKASPSKKYSSLVPVDDEPVKKGKRVKRSARKSTTTPATCIVISDAPVETQFKRKEKVNVARGKGIELLSEVALAEKAQMKEVRKKSLREFHWTHPSGSGMITETPPSVERTKSSVTSEGTGDKPGVPNVTKEFGEMMKTTTMMKMTQKIKAMTKKLKVMMIKLLPTVKKVQILSKTRMEVNQILNLI
nr:hypothetical protein [Tanacetum cinerariifolium]